MKQVHIDIDPEFYYVFQHPYYGNYLKFGGKGDWIIENVFHGEEKIGVHKDNSPQHNHLGNIKPELKSLHVALSRAIEEGDLLKIGIVLGQTVSKLEELINQ